jgi:ABC-type oligopeptide transport system ATPase subunit
MPEKKPVCLQGKLMTLHRVSPSLGLSNKIDGGIVEQSSKGRIIHHKTHTYRRDVCEAMPMDHRGRRKAQPTESYEFAAVSQQRPRLIAAGCEFGQQRFRGIVLSNIHDMRLDVKWPASLSQDSFYLGDPF